MINESLINSVLLDWASRSPDGLLLEELNEDNLEALHSSLMSNGLSEEDAMGMVNDVSVIYEKGKHPERQAYNKNGLLVTFPTPEYKARAIAKGTHFEKNPKVAQSNLFGGGQQAPNAATPATPPAGSPMDAGNSTLPASDSNQPQTPPAKKEVPDPGTPGTPAALPPAGGGSGTAGAPTGTPAQGQLATEPIAPVAPANVAPPATPPAPPPVQKTPQEIAAEKEVIKQIMDTSDTLPTIPGVGGVGISEELKKLMKVALEMNLNEAVKLLSKHL